MYPGRDGIRPCPLFPSNQFTHWVLGVGSKRFVWMVVDPGRPRGVRRL